MGGSYGRSYEYYPGTAVVRKTGAETRSVDLAGNLTAIQTPDASGAALVRHAYQYDRAGRRTKATREDSTYWSYGYNPRGEVTSGRKFTGGGTSLAGHQFLYAYDLIGNRTSAQTGGDGSGGGLRTTSYTANALNQYSLIETPETFDVIGRAPAANTVTVNSQATTRQGERFHRQLTAANATAPVWSSVSVSDGTTTQSGHRFVAKAVIEPGYDGDGNLTGDGRWDYQWDGENRLTVMTTSTIAQTAGVPYQRLVFSYDGQGRRVRKQVFDSPTGAAIDDLRFLYDGWNLLIEYRKTGSSAPAVLRSYLWGQDLAGIDSSGQPIQGAGGVGGLLGVTTGGNSYLPAYDGNDNIVAWLNSSNQLVCKQEYDPFGNRIIHEGSVDLPIGFSTKYRDEETNLLYYGYRYYDPATGIWPSRDPIEEAGGVNLYGMVANDPVNKSDYLGLSELNASDYEKKAAYIISSGVVDPDEIFRQLLVYYFQNDPENDLVWDCQDDTEEIFDALGDVLATNFKNQRPGSKAETDEAKRFRKVRNWIESVRYGSNNRTLTKVRPDTNPQNKFDHRMDAVMHFYGGGSVSAWSGETIADLASWGVEVSDELKNWFGSSGGGFDSTDARWGLRGSELQNDFDVSECKCRKLAMKFVNGTFKTSAWDQWYEASDADLYN